MCLDERTSDSNAGRLRVGSRKQCCFNTVILHFLVATTLVLTFPCITACAVFFLSDTGKRGGGLCADHMPPNHLFKQESTKAMIAGARRPYEALMAVSADHWLFPFNLVRGKGSMA